MENLRQGDRVELIEDIYGYGYMGRRFIETPKGTVGTIEEFKDIFSIPVKFDNSENRFFRRFHAAFYSLKKNQLINQINPPFSMEQLITEWQACTTLKDLILLYERIGNNLANAPEIDIFNPVQLKQRNNENFILTLLKARIERLVIKGHGLDQIEPIKPLPDTPT